ncbi:MAG: restriction endonuclease [Cyclobacteriaceae bacterium]
MNPFARFKVLFQCKRYKGTVLRAQVGDLSNAMIGRAEKGIILTTDIPKRRGKEHGKDQEGR